MRVLVLEELLNLVEDRSVSKGLQAEANEAVDNNGVSELGDDKVPVVLHKLPLDGTAARVSGQVATKHVHIGSRDGVLGRRRVEVEGDEVILDKIGIFHSSKGSEGNELAVDSLGIEPLLLEDFDVASGIVGKTSAPDDASERRVDGVGLGVFNPGVESLDTFRLDPVQWLIMLLALSCLCAQENKQTKQEKIYLLGVASRNSVCKELLAQNTAEVVLALWELPSNLLNLLINQLDGKVGETLLNLLVLFKDRFEVTDAAKNLAPDEGVSLLLEALDKGQEG